MKVEIYGREDCPFCKKAKQFAGMYFGSYDYIDTPKGDAFAELRQKIVEGYAKDVNTVPQIFIGEEHIGGYDDLVAWTLRKDTV